MAPCHSRAGLAEKPDPFTLFIPRIHNPNQTLVSQRGNAFTSTAVLPSATFVQSVAEKPHRAVNGGHDELPVAFLRGGRIPTLRGLVTGELHVISFPRSFLHPLERFRFIPLVSGHA